MGPQNVGILAMEIYFPPTCIQQDTLEDFDGVSKGKYTIGLGQDCMAFCSEVEDVISMGLTAVTSLLEKYGVDPKQIGRLEVGSETVIDKSKSIKTFLMTIFEDCGNTDIEGVDSTNACYGGTAALLNCVNWVESNSWDGRYGLVVCTDSAVYAEGPARPTGGAAAIAMLIGQDAPIAFESKFRASHMSHVYDFYKPDLASEYPVVDGKLSQTCYLMALESCYKGYCQKYEKLQGKQFSIADADYFVFHSPYNKLVQKSFARLVFSDVARSASSVDESAKEKLGQFTSLTGDESYNNRDLEKASQQVAKPHYDVKVQPGTLICKQVGNMYTASIYAAFASLIHNKNSSLDGKQNPKTSVNFVHHFPHILLLPQVKKMPRSLKTPKKAKRKNKGGAKKGEGSSSSSNGIPSIPAKVWQPGVDALEEGEELQCDPSAYNSLHAFHIGWPCLSFDIVRDSLGLVRTEFPHTTYCVTGTQANSAAANSIGIFKISNISGKRRELVPTKTSNADTDMDSESSDSDDDEEAVNDGPNAPVFQVRKVFHEGCVNRIRAMTQRPHICATWGDTGHVQIWDFSSHLNALAESETNISKDAITVSNQTPLVKFTGHKDEGYAIDWSPLVPGRLVSGDCMNAIHLWEPASDSTWNVDNKPFVGHTKSVEDLQWSPTEQFVFASSSVDKTIAIWDTRLGKSPAASIKAHDADVNVISWNRLASCMLASGSDDGTFSIRDLRMLKEGDAVVAHFTYHKRAITSIEWSPHEASTLAVSSDDHQLTIWDLSLERDEEEEAEFKAKTQEEVHAPTDLPPQLLFVHQGQKDLKELHWHTQIPGMLISTAADGFNILMPSNIESNLPANTAAA